MDSNSVIIILGIVLVLTFFIIIKKFISSSNTEITTVTTKSPFFTRKTNLTASSKEELLQKMRESNVPQEIIDNFTNNMNSTTNPIGTYTTSSTSHKVTYVNGEKVSEEKNTTHNTMVPLTNCPNCGAKIKDSTKDNCEYCHTLLTKTQTITK